MGKPTLNSGNTVGSRGSLSKRLSECVLLTGTWPRFMGTVKHPYSDPSASNGCECRKSKSREESNSTETFICLCFPAYRRRLHLSSKLAPPRWTGPLNYEPNKPFLKLLPSGGCQQAREVTKAAPEKQKTESPGTKNVALW